MRALPGLVALLLAAPTAAQIRPAPGDGDPHLQSVAYDANQIVELDAAPGYQLTIVLSPDERVQTVAVGDATAWQVSVNHAGDHLFIKATAPVATNMTAITSVRAYNFDLRPVSEPMADTPYVVRFTYPEISEPKPDIPYVDVSPLRRAQSRYRISGDRTIRPDSVSNDGEHTYISWSRDKAIPAIYAINPTGEETVANGRMRDDVYVVDGVPAKLIFRVDGRMAEAMSLPPKKNR